MTLGARLALVKRVPGGHGVSYGHHYVTPGETTLALVPLGYADGIPRHASGTGPGPGRRASGARSPGGWRWTSSWWTSAATPRRAGDEAVLFGPGDDGEPTAEDWARAAGTIAYEIVTRIGARVPRRYDGAVGEGDGVAGPG